MLRSDPEPDKRPGLTFAGPQGSWRGLRTRVRIGRHLQPVCAPGSVRDPKGQRRTGVDSSILSRSEGN